MSEQPFLKRESRVTIEAAAALTGVPLATLRDWASSGALTIERRGDFEVVMLSHIKILASRQGARRRDTLRHRLHDASSPPPRAATSVEGLQQLVRDRLNSTA